MASKPQKRVKISTPTAKALKRDVQVAVGGSKSVTAATPSETKPKEIDASVRPISNKGKERENEGHLPRSFKVVAGSYEKLLYGLDGTVSIGKDSKLEFTLKPIFIFPAHVSCIKAVASSPQGGKWLASGSADEIIKVWDLRRRKEIGGLMHHEGSITHLTFPSRSHLLSASEDGTLCLFRARDWAVLRSLKGHKGRVNAIAVHPSGKVALSVGKDRALRMWDLMRGKGVASTKIGKEGEIVRWSTDGSRFAVQSGSKIDVYNTSMDILWSITHPSRVHDLKFCNLPDSHGEVLLVCAEDRKLSVYQVPKETSKEPSIIAQMIGHSNRIKAVQTLDIVLPPNSEKATTTIICTASSDGFINIYDAAQIQQSTSTEEAPQQIQPVTSYDSKGTRLTCLTLADGDAHDVSSANGKRKRDNDADETEDEQEWGEPEGHDEEEVEEEAEEEIG